MKPGQGSRLHALLMGAEAEENENEPGPSSATHHSVEDEETEEIANAVINDERLLREQLQRQPNDDPNARDPLAGYDDFNIIEYLAGNENHSPPNGNPMAPGQQRAFAAQLPQQGISNRVAPTDLGPNRLKYMANNARLPESPPQTDISASSASPSSHSDSSAGYSPNHYDNYTGSLAPRIPPLNNNGGLIIGVDNLEGDDAMRELEMLQPSIGLTDPKMEADYAQMQSMYVDAPYSAMEVNDNQEQDASLLFKVSEEYYETMLLNNLAADMNNSNRKSSKRKMVEQPKRQKDGQPTAKSSVSDQGPSSISPCIGEVGSQHTVTTQRMTSTMETPYDTIHMATEMLMDSAFNPNFHDPLPSCQSIKFVPHETSKWTKMYDQRQCPIEKFFINVTAEKGFTYNSNDLCFVNQKKNHFQISVVLNAGDEGEITHVLSNGTLMPVKMFTIMIVGVKSDTMAEVKVLQSDSLRKTSDHRPVEVPSIPSRFQTRIVVPRLHFFECTQNNQRKHNKPNPEQKHFQMQVKFVAHTADGQQHICAESISDKFIVRATNPGQFDTADGHIAAWQTTRDNKMLYTCGPVGIGMDLAMVQGTMHGKLNVNGDIYHAGSTFGPSDIRLKEKIEQINTQEALRKINELRIVYYQYKQEVADEWGLSAESRARIGIIAQELQKVFPEAVKTDGEFLTVDESRLFFQNIAATQELWRMQGSMQQALEYNVAETQRAMERIFRKRQEAAENQHNNNGAPLSRKNSELNKSTYSLAPSFKREIYKAHHHCEEESLCSTKLTQYTIALLVAIMALCLLSMSALYIMDWHHRNYGFPIAPPTVAPHEPIGLMKQLHFPMSQPMAPALHALCTHEGCQSFCCTNRTFYANETRHGGQRPSSIPLAGSREAFLAAIAGIEEVSPRAFFPQPFTTGLRISVQGINMTLDERYCTGVSCNPKRGMYNLFIPMSPFFPSTSLTITIDAPVGQFVNFCGPISEFREMPCIESDDKTKNPTPYVSSNVNKYELPVGVFKRSAYRFRVSHNMDACNKANPARFMAEYNLIFYRTCEIVQISHVPIEWTEATRTAPA